MILLDNVSRVFGARVLFEGLTWQIHPRRRIGLVGPNGAGKTSLFRILAGEAEPDAGRVVCSEGDTIGYLPQDVGDLGDEPVLDHVLAGRPDIVALEGRIEALATRVERCSDAAEMERLSAELADAQERFRFLGGYEFRARAQEILRGMGFSAERAALRASQLSGGWKVRLVLARLLLQRPTVLLMDEPTNHLDLPSVEWLEGFLSGYDGTVIVISHDRYFLNRLVNDIAHIDVDGFHVYPGDYDAFERQREARLELLEKQREQQDRQIRDTERFIERFRSKASKAAAVQSRVRQLEKIDRIELPGERRKMVRFRFAEAPRSGRDVVRIDRVAKRYGENVVYRDLTLRIERGEKIAIVGPNGAGKTTLLRLIRGALTADSGTVELGHQVVCAWFGQHQVEELDLRRTVLEEMDAHATVETAPMVRGVLGAFLFSGDDVGRKVSVLSGGEKSRLALARLLLQPSNLLLLDEPTNHLDMESREVLLQALAAYEGTVIFVSHDRYFINAVAKRVLHVEDARIQDYAGDYEYYRFKRAEEAEAREGATAAGRAAAAVSARSGEEADRGGPGESREERQDRKRREAELRNEISKATRSLRAEVERIEARIAELEAQARAAEERLADPALYEGDGAEVVRWTRSAAEAKSALEELYFGWAEKNEALERTEAAVRARLGAS
jgi:ATP-binding cassette subfamily F protein 3